MSTFNAHLVDGTANGTISKGQFVKYASGGWVACSSLGERSDGVALSDASAGQAVCIQVGGTVKFKCGGTGISDGGLVTTTAGGLGITAVSTNVIRLKARGAVAANAVGEAVWIDAYVAP